jgi:prepilin-type N-terminal cleavage/methylation domain-containing protein
MKRAFTLIELLVVIAIIAILAAILFPVFAQAKEAAKKTQALSNFKQSATAMTLYTTDTDDNMPSQGAISDGNPACGGSFGPAGEVFDTWQWLSTIPAGADDPSCVGTDGQAWVNSVQPYQKNWQMNEQPGFTKRDAYTAAYMATLIKPPASNSLTMNGLLHHYSMSAVANPSGIPMIWAGSFNNNFRGGAYTSAPVLDCTGSGAGGVAKPCRFSPDGRNHSGMTTPPGNPFKFYRFVDANLRSVWHYARGQNFAFTDTSAKYTPVNPGGAAVSTSWAHPFINFPDRGGAAWGGQYVLCSTQAGNSPYYPAFFRPDRTNNTDYTSSTAFALNACKF